MQKLLRPLLSACLLWLAWTAAATTAGEPSTFQFRFPAKTGFHFESAKDLAAQKQEWLQAQPADGSTNYVEFGSRIVVQLNDPRDLPRLTAGSALQPSRTVTENVFILQAPDAITAVREAARLAALPEVTASYPVVRRQIGTQGLYAPAPTDGFFNIQWDLENRTTNGTPLGGDLNVRAAWPYTTGQGVTVAIADTGVEMNHIELTNALTGVAHTNFFQLSTNAGPVTKSTFAAHGTEIAGVIAAQANTARMTGIAPDAKLASWVIFDTNGWIAADDQLLTLYNHHTDGIPVQNHSWGYNNVVTLNSPTLLEDLGISNAVTHGRGGRGVVMVRSCGNDRDLGADADEDGYPNDPRVIAVAALITTGRVTSVSEPGACILVGAPTRDAAGNGLFSTDLLGTNGVTTFNFFPPNQDLSDYVFNSLGFSGTSAAAAEISAVAALILSANTNLSYRDVQQILVLSARHFDLADLDLSMNGAGFAVSHNGGFGIPDAGAAVKLALRWTNRPALTSLTVAASNHVAIPDDGLRLLITGTGVPINLTSVHTLPGTGPHADTPTSQVPLVDVGLATNTLAVNLTNKAALIMRGATNFAQKISCAAQAGATFAVVYNYSTNVASDGGDILTPLGGTDFAPIPAVFIGNTDGERLKTFFATNATALAQINLQTTNVSFNVTNTLLCEHVGLRVKSDHPLRGDLRITLVSPSGTRSILQRFGADTNAGPADWTYWSTHHFFESSAGDWTACFSDESAGATGGVQLVSLKLYGTPITDTDHDGLDDNWELARFGDLSQGPKDDPDKDGSSNLRERLAGTNPNAPDEPFRLDLTAWNQRLARVSWPGSPRFNYQVWQGTNATGPLALATNLGGQFPETEWFTPANDTPQKFFRVQAVALP